MVVNIMAGVILAFSVVTTPEQDAEMVDSTIHIGLRIESLHYTVTLSYGKLIKVELDSPESTDFDIDTDWKTVNEFARKYHDMAWISKVKFLRQRFGVPLKYIMDLKAMGVE